MPKLFKLLVVVAFIFSQSCAYMLNKKEVNLKIDSFPQGADIVIEGRNYGKTPKIIKIEPKNYNVLLKLPNYGSANIKLETWQTIRQEKGEGGRCLADALGTMLILPMFSYWSVYCRDFKQNSYMINIAQTSHNSSRSLYNSQYGNSYNNSYKTNPYNQNYYQQNNQPYRNW